jgi:toxin FitB
LPIDLGVAQYSAGLHVPDPKPYRDGFIGATAHVYGMTLVTRNTGDFADMGVNLFNPWPD